MRATLTHSLMLASFISSVSGSSQGLYVTMPTNGQLLLVNASSNARTPIGTGLSGWLVPACSPTAVDTTGKWIYAFARHTGDGPTSPWTLLSLELRDGTIRKSYELPSAFSPALAACDHALAEDGSWHAFLAAVTHDATPRLIVYRFEYTWPFSNESIAFLDVPLASLDMGGVPAGGLTITVSNFTVWVALERGLVGVDLLTRAPTRRLPIAPLTSLVALQYDESGAERRVFGMLLNGTGPDAALVSFADSGEGVPALSLFGIAGSGAAPRSAGAAAICGDRGTLALFTDHGSLDTLSLIDGSLLSSVPACGGNGVCPADIGCEPFVF